MTAGRSDDPEAFDDVICAATLPATIRKHNLFFSGSCFPSRSCFHRAQNGSQSDSEMRDPMADFLYCGE